MLVHTVLNGPTGVPKPSVQIINILEAILMAYIVPYQKRKVATRFDYGELDTMI